MKRWTTPVFTLEGDPEYLTDLRAWLERLGNSVPVILPTKKACIMLPLSR